MSMTLMLCYLLSNAQPGSIDLTFNPNDIGFGNGDGANDYVNASATQDDGKIIIGGSFTKYNYIERSRLARLNVDGSLDTTFLPGAGADGRVKALAIQQDGKILIGGEFSHYEGVLSRFLARVNPDGSLDPTFQMGESIDGYIYTIAVQADGKILIGGAFTICGGSYINRIARLHTDGSLDTSFDQGTGANATIRTIALQDDGKILIGGQFSSYNDISCGKIARIHTDGSLDDSFNTETGIHAYQSIDIVTILDDGKIIIGGSFSSYQGSEVGMIARLDTDGNLDTSFTSGTGANSSIRSITILNDGKIIIAGEFFTFDNNESHYIARLNSNGSFDPDFKVSPGGSSIINTIEVMSDGKIIVGGNFTHYNEIRTGQIIRLNANGDFDPTFNKGSAADNWVHCIAQQPDAKLIIGGNFTRYDGMVSKRMARLLPDGSLDTSFDIGSGFNNGVNTINIQTDGKIVVGGGFTTCDGTPASFLVRLNADGSVDPSFSTGSGFNGNVRAVELQDDGKILIGGTFSRYNGSDSRFIVRLNTDGSIDNSFDAGDGIGGYIYAIAIQADGKILLGGAKHAGEFRIIRVYPDGSLDTSFDCGSGGDHDIYSIIIQENKIIAGGYFSSFNGSGSYGIVRLNNDGSLDTEFNPGTGSLGGIRSISMQSDHKMIIGGQFLEYNGTEIQHLARINKDGSLDPSFERGSGPNFNVYTTVLQSDDKILFGGGFISYNGVGRNRIARLNNNYVDHVFICEGESYHWQGTEYNTAGVYYDTLTSSTGADSILQLTLEVDPVYSFEEDHQMCHGETYSWQGQDYTDSGVYTKHFFTEAGCDSTYTLDLAVAVIDTTVSIVGETISSNVTAGSYQWVICDQGYQAIEGATNQSYTATTNGHYAVVITLDSCTDTSVCTEITSFSVPSFHLFSDIGVHPNPFSDELIIENEDCNRPISYKLLNSNGQILLQGSLNDRKKVDTSQLPKGVYTLYLDTDEAHSVRKLIKN